MAARGPRGKLRGDPVVEDGKQSLQGTLKVGSSRAPAAVDYIRASQVGGYPDVLSREILFNVVSDHQALARRGRAG